MRRSEDLVEDTEDLQFTSDESTDSKTHLETVGDGIECPISNDEALFAEPLEDSIALLVACDCGDLDAVKRMVEQSGIDVNLTAVYHRLTKRVEGAFPLFVAASCGHEDIVRYLLEKGADVSARIPDNAPNYAGMTALHAAVYFLCGGCRSLQCSRKDAIIHLLVHNGADPSAMTADNKPMWIISKYEVSSTFLLTELGMDLTQRCPITGRSILHYWAGRASVRRCLQAVKFFLENGARLNSTDNDGITPLFLAAMGADWNMPNLPVLEYLMQLDVIDLKDKVTALELAGSSLAALSHEAEMVKKGLEFWQEALELRKVHGLVKSTHIITIVSKEFETSEELKEMTGNLEECRLQSLLVRHRILSNISPNAIKTYQWPEIISFYDGIVPMNQIGQFLDVYSMMLQVAYDPADDASWLIVEDVTYNIVGALECLRKKSLRNPYFERANLLRILRLFVKADRHHLTDSKDLELFNGDNDDPVNYLESISRLIAIVADELPDDDQVVECLKDLVRKDGRDEQGRNILHITCSSELVDSFPIVCLLQKAEADLNAEDRNGNTPLHLLAEKLRKATAPLLYGTVKFLLENTADPKSINAEGRTAREMLEEAFDRHNIQHHWGPYMTANMVSQQHN